jgi:hypothetical protein
MECAGFRTFYIFFVWIPAIKERADAMRKTRTLSLSMACRLAAGPDQPGTALA